jgi:hypothetical protein
MPGPNSAPNGDASLVADHKVECETHKARMSECTEACRKLRKRDVLARSGKLHTGKTQKKKLG